MTAAIVPPAVELIGVEKSFGTTSALERIDLTIGASEFVSLLGPSGCGKTTTLRLIAGIERPTRGELRINGRLQNGVPSYRRNIPLVFQQFALFPHLSVRRNVAFGLEVRGAPKREREARVAATLELVGLTDLAVRSPAELSGGQQQRVAIARAIVTDPDVLLLDEPLGALDANLKVRMQAELKALQRRLGIPFVYVTHNQQEALAMSDRVVVMSDGRIEQVDAPSVLFRNPKTRFVAQFVGKNNIVEGRVRDVHSDMVDVETPFGDYSVVPPSDGLVHRGDRCALVFNADRVLVADPGDGQAVPAEVIGLESIGSLLVCLLRVSELELFMEVHGRDKEDFGVGSRLRVRIDARELTLLAEPSEDAGAAEDAASPRRREPHAGSRTLHGA